MTTLPALALLFLPLCGGLPAVFAWARPGVLAAGSHQAAWLTPTGFYTRSALYLGVLLGAAYFLRLFSRAQSQRDNAFDSGIRSALGGLAAVAYVLAMNFASTDWVMSLEPHWHSTIFAVIIMASQFLSTLALSVFTALCLAGPHRELLTPLTLRDLGNLLLAFVVFWTYVTFSQFLIIWSGNLPREIAWYEHRREGGWREVAVGLAALQFAVPLVLLLSRRLKAFPARLAAVAGLVFLLGAVHVFWLVVPAWHPEGVRVHGLDLAAFLAIGGIFGALFLRQLGRAPLLTTEVRHG